MDRSRAGLQVALRWSSRVDNLVHSRDCTKQERCRLRVVDSSPPTTIRRKTFNARENFLSSSLNDVIWQTHSCSPCQNGPSSSTKNALSVHAWPAKTGAEMSRRWRRLGRPGCRRLHHVGLTAKTSTCWTGAESFTGNTQGYLRFRQIRLAFTGPVVYFLTCNELFPLPAWLVISGSDERVLFFSFSSMDRLGRFNTLLSRHHNGGQLLVSARSLCLEKESEGISSRMAMICSWHVEIEIVQTVQANIGDILEDHVNPFRFMSKSFTGRNDCKRLTSKLMIDRNTAQTRF